MRVRAAATAAALAAVAVLVYLPVLDHPFVQFDDPAYVTANPHVRYGLSFDAARWASTGVYLSNWQPLTWLSHMLDFSLWGPDPRGHHATSLALHAANVALLFLALLRMSGAMGPAALVALLFAVHPLNVEAVAWVAARRDVLAGLFWMAGLLAWSEYARRSSWWWYGVAALALALGGMAKPMVVSMPFVLLLLDFWPLGRWSRTPRARLWLEKLPLAAIAAAIAAIAWLAARSDGALHPIPFAARAINAAISCVRYVGKLLWPAHLAAFYPHPADLGQGTSPARVAAACVVVLLLVAWLLVCVRQAGKRPYLLVGSGWFLLALGPAIGLVQFGRQALADRYAYLPAIGIFVMVAWAAAELARTRPAMRAPLLVAAGAALPGLTLAGHAQIAHWRDSVALFERAIAVTGPNVLAEVNLGTALEKRGDIAGATRHLERAIAIDPTFADARANLAAILLARGDRAGARLQLEQALRTDPSHAQAQFNLGWLLEQEGALGEAAVHYSRALETMPEHIAALNNLGVVLARLGDLPAAADHFRRALDLKPEDEDALLNLARVAEALAGAGRVEQAADLARETIARAEQAERPDLALRLREQFGLRAGT